MTNYCDKCGKVINPDDLFCNNCGSQLDRSKTWVGRGTVSRSSEMISTTNQRSRTSTQPKRFYRSRENRWLAGICGGLGEYFDIDPILVRIAFIFLMPVYGIGIILGAGIYALIGVGAGIAGNMLWLAFIIAAVIASFTGLSYAELSSMYPKEAAEYNYTKNAFRKETLSFLVSWTLIGVGLISAATVALGFGGYFYYISGFDVTLSAVFLIIILLKRKNIK